MALGIPAADYHEIANSAPFSTGYPSPSFQKPERCGRKIVQGISVDLTILPGEWVNHDPARMLLQSRS